MSEFLERYRDKTNLDLILILERAADYQPEAVEAAEQVLREREVSEEERERLCAELQANPVVEEPKRVSMVPLPLKLLTFVLPPIGLIFWLQAVSKREVDHQRHKELGRYLFLGAIIWAMLLFAIKNGGGFAFGG